MKQRQFYCLRCDKKRMARKEDISIVKHSGVPAMSAECRVCGTQMSKWIKRDSHDRMKKKFA